MPVVKVDWWKGRTREQKSEIAKRITDAFKDVADVPPEKTQVVFFDVEQCDWAVGGKLCDKE